MGNTFRTLEGSQSTTEDDSQFIESYNGETTKEGVYHGKGILCYSSDDSRQRERYEGEWYQGKRNGKGTLSWRNGAVYQGTWKDDMLHGMGIFLLPSGLCYEGIYDFFYWSKIILLKSRHSYLYLFFLSLGTISSFR